ncbi:DUF2958 domain-containing protein (plasmid) [Mesorhizobium sp. AR02]|nr:DUF2958 domain-containing protein [Mesorhizobium sp. AR02]UVK50262.1 DUF2958 domain-containing protein [Mesorhizobium sp. AR02]
MSIAELESVRGPFGLGIQRDIHWTAAKKLSAYADDARRLGRISV